MNKIILALAWEMWCGKWTVVKYLIEKYGWVSYKFSQILRDILDRLYLDQSRENFQIISPVLRQAFWEDLFAKAIFNDLKNNENSLIILDWVRRKSDIVNLKGLPYFKFIYIETNLENRFNRIKIRWENTDDLTKTFEQFKLDQQGETELQIAWLKNDVDYIIDNNWNLEELYIQIDNIMSKIY